MVGQLGEAAPTTPPPNEKGNNMHQWTGDEQISNEAPTRCPRWVAALYWMACWSVELFGAWIHSPTLIVAGVICAAGFGLLCSSLNGISNGIDVQ